MTAIQKWLVSLAATILATVVSYLWVDRPIALMVHAYTIHRETFSAISHIPDPLVPLAVVIFAALGLLAMSGRPLSKTQTAVVLCSISLIIAETTKNLLKYVFGRTWPETWFQNNPSYVRDGDYGFNLFHGGSGYASFPSGHSAVTCAVVTVLWVFYPKLWPLYSVVVLAVAIGLIGENFHFLSDVIAGAFVGASIGFMIVALWQTSQSAEDPK